MKSSDILLREAAMRLREGGGDSFRLDARLLLAAVMGLAPDDLLFTHEVCEEAERRFFSLVARRIAGEPVSRIMGRREFWSMDFSLSPETLDPRPDSETVVEFALSWAKKRGERLDIWDAGTGTGCLLLALLSELPLCHGTGSDVSEGALATAQVNAMRLGLSSRAKFVRMDWLKDVPPASIDLFISNPPYIPEGDIPGLAPEVRVFDPAAALAGGPDGLSAYREIAKDLPRVLKPDGAAFLEFGRGQEDAVADIMEKAGMKASGMRADLAGITRAVQLLVA